MSLKVFSRSLFPTGWEGDRRPLRERERERDGSLLSQGPYSTG